MIRHPPFFFAGDRRQVLARLSTVGLIAALIALPAALGSMGWLHSLIPLPIYFVLYRDGEKLAQGLIILGVLIAGLVALASQTFSGFLFALTLLPVGFFLYYGERKNEALSLSTGKALAYLLLTWLAFGWLFGLMTGTKPYRELEVGLAQGFAATAQFYRDSGQITGEELKTLTDFIGRLSAIMVQLLPALLFTAALCTVWLNLVLGRRLCRSRLTDFAPSSQLKDWRLPDLLVWLVIAAGATLLVSGEMVRLVGLNLGLTMLVLYLTQGMAVLSCLFAKWSLPPLFRAFLYTLLFLQAYGLALVAAIGLADIWADFRRPRVTEKNEPAEY